MDMTLVFDEKNPNWRRDAEQNRLFTQCQISYMNHVLKARGVLFVNEFLDAMGFDRTTMGQLAGWTAYEDEVVDIEFGAVPDTSNYWVKVCAKGCVIEEIDALRKT